MSNTVDKVLKIAEAEVGYLEKSKAAYLKDKTVLDKKTEGAGSDNYTKYGRDMHEIYPSVMDFPAYWCDSFVDWCFYKAYGIANAKGLLGGNFDDYTVASAQLYKNKNAWYTSTPLMGDQIFFKNSTRICHTGLVYKVDSKKVYTIEGNTSGGSDVISNGGGVFKKEYLLTDSRIAGYGRPKYDIQKEFVEGFQLSVDGKRWWYQYQDGSYAVGWKWLTEKTGGTSGWYYFDQDGYMLTGYQNIDGQAYVLCPEQGIHEGQCMKSKTNGALYVPAQYDHEKGVYLD